MSVTVGSKEYVEAQQTLNELASRAAGLFHLQTPAQKAQQTAYNEFIVDYVERHGECKATRDEAHEVADGIGLMARQAVGLANEWVSPISAEGGVADEICAILIDATHNIDGKEAAKFLSACAIAAALEVVA